MSPDCGDRPDLIVDGAVIVGLNTLRPYEPIFSARHVNDLRLNDPS